MTIVVFVLALVLAWAVGVIDCLWFVATMDKRAEARRRTQAWADRPTHGNLSAVPQPLGGERR